MKRRTVYVLAAIFALLVVLVAATRWWTGRSSLPAPPPIDFSKAGANSVDRVVIGSVDGTTSLVRVPGGWVVRTRSGESSASAGRVTQLFAVLGGANFDRLVTSSAKPSDLGAYGLTPPTARRVAIYEATTPAISFTLGSATGVPGTDYLQARGSTAVWAVSGGLRDALDPNPAVWKASPSPATSTAPPSGAPLTPQTSPPTSTGP